MLPRYTSTAVDQNGTVLPGASVEVRRQATDALVSIYSDADGTTPLSNPMTADGVGATAGRFYFHISPGVYKITVTSGAYSAIWEYVSIGPDLTGAISNGTAQLYAGVDYFTVGLSVGVVPLYVNGVWQSITIDAAIFLDTNTLSASTKYYVYVADVA